MLDSCVSFTLTLNAPSYLSLSWFHPPIYLTVQWVTSLAFQPFYTYAELAKIFC